MSNPTAWQLGEELKAKFLPMLKDIKEVKGRLELRISNMQDEFEFAPRQTSRTNIPVPEDPQKMKRLVQSLIQVANESMEKYEQLCSMEANDFHAMQETGQVSTTCPDVGIYAESLDLTVQPTPVTDEPCPFPPVQENMDVQESLVADVVKGLARSSSPAQRPRLLRGDAVENEESMSGPSSNRTIDLAK